MSNKLVKSKSNMEKKLEYYEKHCALLEKENEDLKQQIIDNEIGLSIVKENASESYDNLSLLIKKARMSKNIYEMLCVKYNDRIKVLDEQITEIDKVKKEYTKKMQDFEKQYQKMLDNLLSK